MFQFGNDESDSEEDDSDLDSYYTTDDEPADNAGNVDEVLSQAPSVRPSKTLDATELLLHPVPAEPEDDTGLTTDEDSDWETSEEKGKG